MNTRLLLNLLLACVAVALVLIVMYRPGLEGPPGPAPITRLDASRITRINVTRQQHEPLAFIKSGDGWQLENHHGLRASAFQLRALLGTLTARPGRRYPVTALDLAGAGLQPPQASLQLDDAVIDIGNTNPLDRYRYIRHNDTVYLVTDSYQHLINARWTNFVDRHLLPPGRELRAIELPGLQLRRAEDQRWQLTDSTDSTDAAALQAFVQRWQNAAATYLRAYNGEAGTATVTLTDTRGEHIELLLLKREPEFVLARPDWGIQYYFQGETGAALLAVTPPQAPTDRPAQP